MQKRRSIAAAAAVLAIAAVLAGCTAAVEPAVSFAAEKLTISLPRMVVGQAVPETTLPEAMGGKQELAYSLVPDIPGLTFNPATRVLNGTPTMPGTYNMTYTAKDTETGGTMESVKFTIVVDARPVPLAELLHGSWRTADPWEDDDRRPGRHVVTLTFTKSRWIRQVSEVYDDGEPEAPWANGASGSWTATDQELSLEWREDDDDGALLREHRSTVAYQWANADHTAILVQEWDEEVTTGQYRLYTKVSLGDLEGTWTFGFENEDGVYESWDMVIGGSSFEWVYRPNPEMAYPSSHRIAEVDETELVIVVVDDEDPEEALRFAYAAGYDDDAIALSPSWDEANPERPDGDYWMLMRRR